eukprot:TRINITY_DN9393_c0_g1_i2.p1 TRINITY_DN9393_c0_g1~~TRINITY_DN9393_c0_g1_i2.p1  ORF type:complete len:390 (-),score=66.39 TRINITY_DN9393_c0_g1_i2:115-1284(-)
MSLQEQTMRGFYVSVDHTPTEDGSEDINEVFNARCRDDLPIPTAERDPDGVVVKVAAAAVSSDALRFVHGQYLAHLAPFPCIVGTGCVGYVHAIGKDVISDLKVGELVLCTCYIGDQTDGILKGLIHFGSEASRKMQRRWRDGSWAEYAVFPAYSVYPIRGDYVATLPPALLARVERMTISYSALLSGGFKAGQIVAVGGATGALGSACLALALSLGAAKVYALGRRTEALQSLVSSLNPKFRNKVTTLALDETESDADFATKCSEVLKQRNQAPHLYVDALGVTPSILLTQIGLRGLRPGGTAVLFGGVRGDIQFPYGDLVLRGITLKGSFMYPPSAPQEVLGLIDAQIIEVEWMKYEEYTLDHIEEAMQRAAVEKGERASVLVFPSK